MAHRAEHEGGRGWSAWRIAGWSIPVLLLMLPAVAMQFTSEVNWTASDFVFAAVLFGSVGLAFELIVRKSDSLAYRFGAGLAVVAAFLTVWVNAAVGMIGSEDNPYNFVFGGVLFIALIGALLARFEPAGMARAMAVTAVAQVVAGAIGLTADPRSAVFSMGFGGLWLLSAALFWNAAREQGPAGSAR
ncbi:hypothetical protein [Sphingomonas sp.]|uniref:hypothetical protein n=1 Tax=Sphingomonas sp. TaxID=28214 RepID=UPI0025E01C57|nr:hypothetical protein [Sphingomonas sp.]